MRLAGKHERPFTMAKQTTVAAPPVQARPVTGGKPVANTTKLERLAMAMAAYGKQAKKRGGPGTIEMKLLDGRTYDQLAEELIELGSNQEMLLVEGIHFKLDSKLKSIVARFKRALAGDNRDALHKLTAEHVSWTPFEAIQGFSFIDDDGNMLTEDVPNLIKIETHVGIDEKREALEALQASREAKK